jgi:hypothetical protein
MSTKRRSGWLASAAGLILLLAATAAAAPAGGGAPAATQLGFATPETGATVRGMARIAVRKSDPGGYVAFRIDDRFAHATVAPFEMRWDTSTTRDGEHTVQADAYDDSGAHEGTSSIRVKVANQVPLTDKEGVKLTVRFRQNEVVDRQVTGSGELGELALDETLPPGLEELAARLTASMSEIVLDAFYKGSRSLLRHRIRKGGLLIGASQRELSEMGKYATVEVSRNGLALPILSSPDRPRIPLGEISFALADFPVKEGDTWRSPLGVIPDLLKRQIVFVRAEHTFNGVWYFQGRECAKITSKYTLPDIELPLSGAFLSARATPTWQIEFTQGAAVSGYPAPGVAPGGAGSGALSGLDYREQWRAQRRMALEALRQQRRLRPTRSRLRELYLQQLGLAQPGAAGTATAPAAPQVVQSAKLTDLGGTRTTWLAVESGKILRTEDEIRGRLSFSFGSEAAPSGAGAVGMPAMPPMPGGMPVPTGLPAMISGVAGMPGLVMPGMPGAAGALAPGAQGGIPPEFAQMGRQLLGQGISAETIAQMASQRLGRTISAQEVRQATGGEPGTAGPPGATAAEGGTEGPKKVPPSLTYSLTLVTQLVGPT